MSLEKLGRDILERAESQAEKTLEEARAQARGINAEAKRKAEERKRELLKAAEEEAKGKERGIYAARLQAARVTGRARDALVHDCLDAVLEELRDYSRTRAYERTLERLINQGKRELGGDAAVYVKKADGAIASKHAKVAGFIETTGGAVIESRDARMRVDSTFEALVEEKREELAKRVFAELYGKKREKTKTTASDTKTSTATTSNKTSAAKAASKPSPKKKANAKGAKAAPKAKKVKR
ncbi:hypothetical protein AUJ16_02010 [Candidatus Micrarchaeota archaeon CG1_02_60_51]|nr:MAG: hypothetical protein AUJ16_02010 [Candidatus Micrarchaeota archaeon CG1_02_60_51]